MDNTLSKPANPSMEAMDRISAMYPDIYTRVYPHAKDVVDAMSDDKLNGLTQADVDKMADEAVMASGMANDPPPGHNRISIGDIARIMVLRELFERHRRRRFTGMVDSFFFPPFMEGRERERFFDRDRDRR